MEIVVALIGLTMAVIVAAYIAAPFTARSRVIAVPEETLREKLQAERDTVLFALRDLDFDFQTGKLGEADYRATRERYAARGVEILKELDALGDEGKSPAAVADEIEAAVQARRKAKPVPSALKEDDIEAAVRARRQSARGAPQSTTLAPAVTSAGVRTQCPECGRPIDPSDRFCARCGAALTVEANH
jgi:hypothetical protein